jgi:NAD(P)-dependent dehydrogenase (short-subunit alcohol dehydrogenase family)
MPRLVVFGARNLGRAIAEHFLAEGWDAVAVARSAETIAALPEGIHGIVADAASEEDVERVFAEAGAVDLVVTAITTSPSFGGPVHEAPPEALDAYVGALLPGIFNVMRTGGRVLAAQGRGTLIQITGGSARRGNAGRGPWAAAAFATRALVQSQAAELREEGVHVALLIVDATIDSPKTADRLKGAPEEMTASQDEIVRAVAYLESQSPRAWTHELQLTPRLDRWVP